MEAILKMENLLQVNNLKTYFFVEDGMIKAVDGVDFEILAGETLGVVGESGCGKSVTSLTIMRLIAEPPGKVVDGEIRFNGVNLITLNNKEMRKIRGKDISMIFQEPMTSLNPVYTIGNQISEAICEHKQLGNKAAMAYAVEMLKQVGIPEPNRRVHEYPHQLSGGMRQRAMIATALSCDPQLLIADEPTTALDVTIQAQILHLINRLKEKLNMAIMMITHDLGVIAEVSDRVAVMYAGKIVEYTDTISIFGNPMHPYTWGLLSSIPRIDQEFERLHAIPGVVPNPQAFPPGCAYHTRCPLADEQCKTQEPVLIEVNKNHKVRCWHINEFKSYKAKTGSG
jgi:peptide/nickel transport system ATP-binding protein/oligopeptide transport system ATP-binding protein